MRGTSLIAAALLIIVILFAGGIIYLSIERNYLESLGGGGFLFVLGVIVVALWVLIESIKR